MIYLQIGEYDSDEGELWEDDEDEDISEASWDTESEHSVSDLEDSAIIQKIGSFQNTKTDVFEDEAALYIIFEKARVAMTPLEEIFEGNPTMQTTVIMKQLLDVYKDCRKLDKLMETSFFDEDNFDGLIEKLRDAVKYPQMNHQQALKEQFTRLFSVCSQDETYPIGSKDSEMQNDSKSKILPSNEDRKPEHLVGDKLILNLNKLDLGSIDSTEKLEGRIKSLKNNLMNQTNKNMDTNAEDNTNKAEGISSQTCSRLCSLIKAQLVKSHKEVTIKYGGQASAFTQEDLEQNPGEEEADLDEIMSGIMDTSCSSAKKAHVGEEKENAKEETATQAFKGRPKLCRGVSDYDISGRF